MEFRKWHRTGDGLTPKKAKSEETSHNKTAEGFSQGVLLDNGKTKLTETSTAWQREDLRMHTIGWHPSRSGFQNAPDAKLSGGMDRDLFEAHGPGGYQPVTSATDRYYDSASGTYTHRQGDQAGSNKEEISEQERNRIRGVIDYIKDDLATWNKSRIKNYLEQENINTPQKAKVGLGRLKERYVNPNKVRHDAIKRSLEEIIMK